MESQINRINNTTPWKIVKTIILSVWMFLANNLSASNQNYPYPEELVETLTHSSEPVTTLTEKTEKIEKVDPNIIINLVLRYFKNAKAFKLTNSTGIEDILRSYLKQHTILITNNNEVEFYIDDRDQFINMLEEMAKVISSDIEKKINSNNILINVWLLLKGTNKKELQELLNGLKENFYGTVYNMPPEEYNRYVKELFGMVNENFPSFNKQKSYINLQGVFNKDIQNNPESQQTAKL